MKMDVLVVLKVFLQTGPYLLWLIWALMIYGISLTMPPSELGEHVYKILVFFTAGAFLCLFIETDDDGFLWAELSGTARERQIQAFLLALVHALLTAGMVEKARRTLLKRQQNFNEASS